MSKKLTVNKGYEQVECPICGKAWWQQKESGWEAHINGHLVHCPSCNAPLNAPTEAPELRSIKDDIQANTEPESELVQSNQKEGL